MDPKYLIINPGSASKKYALYQNDAEKFFAHFEQESHQYIVTLQSAKVAIEEKINPEIFASAVNFFLEKLLAKKIIANLSEITAIGIRVVAPGTTFTHHRIIDHVYQQKLLSQQASAPLHINPLLAEIKQLSKVLPQIPLVGISDSAFHATLPAAHRYYAIPFADSTELDLYRFGYHGISVQSLLPKIATLLGQVPPRIVACHLGGGASVTAIKDGESMDNSMGYTPLEGLIMATRVGNIDAGALIKLAQTKNLNLPALDEYLNTKSGLLGLSEQSGDIRKLLELEADNPQAQLALSAYITRIKQYIGAYTALLNGLDLLVFTATVGERSNIIRDRICANLEALGISLDQATNKKTDSTDTIISTKQSPVTVAVLTTNEMSAIAEQTKLLLKA